MADKKESGFGLNTETIEIGMKALELAIEALMRVKWLFERPGATFTDAEKAHINKQLDDSLTALDAIVKA